MVAIVSGHGDRPRHRCSMAIASALMLVPAWLSGCASVTRPRWPVPAIPSESPLPSEPVNDPPRSELPKRRGRSKPQTAPASETRAADDGVALTSSEMAPNPAKEISTPVIPPPIQEYAIDLTTALRLAEVENPLIAEARQRIGEALAIQQGAQALLLPSLNIGTNFRSHTGDLQRPSGRILSLDLKSLYFGGGDGAWGTGTVQIPAVNIFSPLTDAIFEPLAARQQVERARFDASATANNVLLDVSELHFELLAADADLSVRRESATQAAEVARLTRAYAQAGQGREADAQRAATEYTLIVNEIRQAEEEVAVAAARLSRRLHLEQSVRLRPFATEIEMVTIVDPTVPLPDLIQTALQGRPEYRARAAALAAAEVHHQQERYRPFLPTLWFGFSAGAFGGGSNLVGNELSHFGGRTDTDVMVFWTLQNFGLGNLALQRQRLAEAGQAAGEQSRVIAQIRSEVSAAYADVMATRQQVNLTTRQLASAEAGFREDLERIRNTVGRPIEVVNSLQLLNEARVARIRAVTDYNKAEFRLFVHLGSPPPLGNPPTAPLPLAPVATPPLPPFAGLVADTKGSVAQTFPTAAATRRGP
jgi:outer membrane protein TolC